MKDEEIDRINRLFAQKIPEIAAGVVEIKAIARRAGLRTKIALQSHDPQVDGVAACVGLRGCRILKIVEQLGAEQIDLFGWNNSPETLIATALQPAVIEKVILHHAHHRAVVVVKEDQMVLVEDRWEVNRDLASRLCGWEIQTVVQ